MTQLTQALLEKAKTWLYQSRKKHHANASVWQLLFHWKAIYPELLNSLRDGSYSFAPMTHFSHQGSRKAMWEAKDAVVIKALSMLLETLLSKETHSHCYHLKPNKGLKAAVKLAHKTSQGFKYVLKVDVKNYYQSMDHETLYQHCARVTNDQSLLKILWRAIKRVDLRDGIYTDIKQGVPTGSSLSNIFGALYLSSVDQHFASQKGLVYIRYMDDILIMCNSTFKLRRSLRSMYRLMTDLNVEIHRGNDKFYIGQLNNGVDFLGYRIKKNERVMLSTKTLTNALAKLRVLYEQQSSPETIAQYCNRFWRWATGGLGSYQLGVDLSIYDGSRLVN